MKFFDKINKLINQSDTLVVVISKESLALSLSSAAKEYQLSQARKDNPVN